MAGRRRIVLCAFLCACSTAADDGSGGTSAVTGTSSATSTSSTTGAGGAPIVQGLRADYFADYLDLVVTTLEGGVDHDWKLEGPPGLGVDRFSARWTGWVVAPKTGDYTIAIESDDGVRLWIGETRVIDDWHGHFVTRNEAVVHLEAGARTPLRLDYFELDIEASARLLWSTATMAEQVIPSTALETDNHDPGLPGPKPPFSNPVIASDCPDPGVLGVDEPGGRVFYSTCTGGSFPIRASRTLVTWTDTGASLLPAGKPAWAANGFRNWAAEVHRVGDAFVGYYTSVNGADVLSIGATRSTSPAGTYTDGGGPLVQDPQGVLDPNFFEDADGSRWLLYKVDGNATGKPTPIYVRRLADDGMSFASGSAPKEILRNEPSTWEGGVVEAPWLVRHEGTYYLFYSGNVYDHRYRTGVARSANLMGPYEKHGAPILTNNATWVGPGHGSVVQAGALDYFVFHAWKNAGNGTAVVGDGRQVLVDRITWGTDGWPSIADGSPTAGPQPWPGEPE